MRTMRCAQLANNLSHARSSTTHPGEPMQSDPPIPDQPLVPDLPTPGTPTDVPDVGTPEPEPDQTPRE